METLKPNHFCTCDDLTCVLNPNNPNPSNQIQSCDPCIRKNLKAGEIPSCFFLMVKEDLADVEDFSIDGFVAFYLNNKQVTNQPLNGKDDTNEV